jgi:hypothetical protein
MNVVTETHDGPLCQICARPGRSGDRFCGSCGAPLAAPVSTAAPDHRPTDPAEATYARDEPATIDLTSAVHPVPARTLLTSRQPMCLLCGADRDTTEACPACGGARVVLPAFVTSRIGSIHSYRKGLRKRLALRVAEDAETSTLLMHDGTTSVLPHDQLPPDATHPPLPDDFFSGLRGPLSRLVRYGIAVQQRELSLPWSGEALIDLALATARDDPVGARLLAVDLLSLHRPDLLDRVGLGPHEVTWLCLVHAARAGNVERVVSCAADLPPDRYREKIAILATFLEGVRTVPGAEERLRPALDHYATDEPLAGVLRGALGIEPRDARQYAEDIRLLAATFPLPAEIRAAVTAAVASPDGDTSGNDVSTAVLGPAGRLGHAHTRPAAASVLRPGDLADAPLAILDDLADAGALDPDLVTASTRSDADITYLLGRIAPERLSDEQVAALGHTDEQLRRAFLRDDRTTLHDGPESATRAHLAALTALLRNRPQDVDLAHVAVENRQQAERLLAVLRTVPDGGDPIELFTEPLLEDRTVWRPIVTTIGLDRLHPTQEVRDRFPRFFAWVSLVQAREHLFLARWEQGVQAARDCLVLATDDAVRNEARNLEACGLYYLGENRPALQVLESALDGDHALALLVNAGVVAAESDPELAATYLARIVREAPTLAIRADAARRAWLLWEDDESATWQGGDHDKRTLPVVLRAPLRTIVTEPIDLAEFQQIVAVLAEYDKGWLASSHSLDNSPHRDSLEARYFRARAQDLFAAVGVLATVTDWHTAPAWLVEQRDALVTQTGTVLFDNIDDPSDAAATIAAELVTRVGGIAVRDRVFLSLLAVAALAYRLSEDGQEVSDELVGLLTSARGSVAVLDGDDGETAHDLLELATRRVALNQYEARSNELNSYVEPYDEALAVLAQVGPGTSSWFSARHVVIETIDVCQRCRAQVNEWIPLVDHPDVLRDLHGFIEHTREFEFHARQVLG